MKKLFLASTILSAALLAGCAATQAHESTGQYLDDTAITAKVKSELLAKEGVSASDISVETLKGEVQLGGFAKSEREKQRAAEIASSVSGVKQMHNDVLVR